MRVHVIQATLHHLRARRRVGQRRRVCGDDRRRPRLRVHDGGAATVRGIKLTACSVY